MRIQLLFLLLVLLCPTLEATHKFPERFLSLLKELERQQKFPLLRQRFLNALEYKPIRTHARELLWLQDSVESYSVFNGKSLPRDTVRKSSSRLDVFYEDEKLHSLRLKSLLVPAWVSAEADEGLSLDTLSNQTHSFENDACVYLDVPESTVDNRGVPIEFWFILSCSTFDLRTLARE